MIICKHLPKMTHPDPKQNFIENTGHCGHLIYTTLHGPWFYINGEQGYKFKTRGDNEKDLRNACIDYNIDFWESEIQQVAKSMSDQLYTQAINKQRYEVFLKRGASTQ